MARKDKSDASQLVVPTLQRLKTLEKDYPSFSAQLEEVAHIIDQPHILEDTYSPTQDGLQFAGKADWALRWITKKLGSDGDDAGARSSVQAWNLLGNLLRVLPIAHSTQTLNAANFLHSLERALPVSLSQHRHAANMQPTTGHTKQGAKRRKLSIDQDQTMAGGYLVTSIARCLDILENLARTSEDSGSSLDAEYVRSALRTDGERAASILRGYYTAQSRGYNGSIDPFLSIWNGRSLHVTDDATFAKTCLIAGLVEPRPDMHTQSRRITERLIAKHVILPARTAYHVSKGRNEIVESDTDMEHLLQTYVDYTKDNADVRGGSCPESQIASRLLEIGIRSTSLDSTRKRALEKPWLEALFCHLAFAANDLTKHAPGQTKPELLCALLTMAIRHRLRLSTTLLGRIAREYTSWTIISLLVQLDADFFVNATYQDVSDRLWSALTQDFHNASPEVSMSKSYDSAKKDIVAPLLHAYARARRLPEFISRWKTQLASRTTGEDAHLTSIWQDQELAWVLKDLLESSLDAEQIEAVVQELLVGVQDISGDHADFAALALLDTVLSALQSTRTVIHLASAISSIRQLCIDNLSASSTVLSLRISLWRLYATCHTLESEIAAQSVVEDVMMQDLYRVCQSVKKDLTTHGKSDLDNNIVNIRAQALESLGKILDNMSRRGMPQASSTKANGVSSKAARSETSPDGTAALNLPSDVIKELSNICSLVQDTLCIEGDASWWQSCATVALKYPLLFLLDHEHAKRQQIVSSIILRKSKKPITEEEEEADNASTLLASLLCRAARREPLLLEDLKHALYQESANLSGFYEDKKSPETHVILLEMVYLGLSAELIPRVLRERAIDAVCGSLTSAGPQCSLRACIRRLSLATSLLRLPHGGSSVPMALVPVGRAVANIIAKEKANLAPASQLYRLLSEFAALTLKQLVEQPGDVKHKDSIKQVCTALENGISERDTGESLPIGELIIAKEYTKLDHWQTSELQDQQQDLLVKIHRRVSEDVKSKSKADSVWIETVTDLLSAPTGNISTTAQSTLKLLGDFVTEKSNNIEVARTIVDLHTETGSHWNLDSAFATLENKYSVEESSQVRQHLSKSLEKLGPDALDILLQRTVQQIGRLGAQSMLALFLSSVQVDWTEKSQLSGVLVVLCAQITKSSDIRSFEHIAAAITSVLRLKVKNLSQHAVETVLASVTALTSTTSPELPARHAALIYSRLSGIMVILLTVHRRNLRSRFHLLLAPLGGLLRCFFAMDDTLPPKARLQQPPWISHSAASNSTGDERPHGSRALGPAHAAALSRILTLICEPSASAVRSRPLHAASGSSNNRPHLIDETAAARAYAGKYMGYFVISVCECLLKGRLASAETRDALLQPGVWSVFSVVPKDVLEAQASAGVRGEGRAVLRGLLEEWRRAGGGRIV